MEARKETAIKFTTGNDPGTMGKVFSKFADAGINITALSAWAEGNRGEFIVIGADNSKITSVLKESGYEPETMDVVVVKAINKVGVAAEVGNKLGNAGINIEMTFAAPGVGSEGILILLTKDNDKAVVTLS